MNRDVSLQPASGGAAISLQHDEIRVGRLADNDIHLDEPTVSRRHACIIRRGASFAVQDLGSSNGTFVNRRRITGITPIQDGDLISFGPRSFIVRVAAAQSDSTEHMPAVPPPPPALPEPGGGPYATPLGPAPPFTAGPALPLGPAPAFSAPSEVPPPPLPAPPVLPTKP